MKLTRRSILRGSAAALTAPVLTGIPPLATPAGAQGQSAVAGQRTTTAPVWRHGLSLFDEIKYPAGFKHFEYVNPNAPKGGIARQIAFGTFDNLNVALVVKGSVAAGLNLVYDTLMTGAMDEVATEYGRLAEAVSHPDDFSSVTYRLRANARWHDGKPITPEDVIFSLKVFQDKTISPRMAAYYSHVVGAQKTGAHEVTFTFDKGGNRELPQIVGQLTILPKHWWEGSDASGRKRDVSATTLEIPLGSGPYRLKEFAAGRTLVYERVPDYWGAALPVNVGQNNFQEIRYEYYRETTVALEAFKADRVDWRSENSAKNWATAYDFPAVKDGRVILEEFEIRSSGVMQAFAFNIRRDKFKDPRVRRAFNFAFDFEEMNKQLFYGQYTRIKSYFEGTELACEGVPQGEELAILETVRGKVPPEVFTAPYSNPVGGSTDAVRANLREGIRLLKDAGYDFRDRRLVHLQSGEPLTVELLASDPNGERFNLFYKPSLERLGIGVTVRTVDDVQYENRLRQWDYDVITTSWRQSLSPGNEQRSYWGSQAADQPGSLNLVGIKDAAIDALIDRVIFATNRSELVAATRALDRVLLWNHFVVPQWTYGKIRTARWDRFSRPDPLPKYGFSGFPTVWWWDVNKAAKTGSRS